MKCHGGIILEFRGQQSDAGSPRATTEVLAGRSPGTLESLREKRVLASSSLYKLPASLVSWRLLRYPGPVASHPSDPSVVTPRSLAGAGRGSRILRTYVIRSDSDSRPGESSRLKVLNLIPPAKPLVKPHSQTRGLGHGRLWEAQSACHGTCSSQESQPMRCGKC